MRRSEKKIAKYHPRKVRRKLFVGLSLLWVTMVFGSLLALDLSHHGRTRVAELVAVTFGLPDEVAYDFVDRGGLEATLRGDLEQFLESKDGIGYDAEVKLVEDYGWTRQQIVDRYPTTAWKSPARSLVGALGLADALK